MKNSEELYNKLLDKSIEWSEDWNAPLTEIAPDLVKNLSAEEQAQVVKYVESVKRDVLRYIYQEYKKKMYNPKYKISNFDNYIKKNYPWMNKSNKANIISQATYNAWKDGLAPEKKIATKDIITVALIIVGIILIIFLVIAFAPYIFHTPNDSLMKQ